MLNYGKIKEKDKNSDVEEKVVKAIIKLLKKTVGNIICIPRLPLWEKCIALITIFVSFTYLYMHHYPRFTLILVLNYFFIKSFGQIFLETIRELKYKNLGAILNDQVKIIAMTKEKVVLHSYTLPIEDIQKKKPQLQLFFNRRIESITNQKNNLRVIEIKFKDNNVKFKGIYPISKYIKTVNLKPHRIPFLLGKNIKGKDIVVDLKELKHMLISGETGGGKSTIMHSIIQSMMYFNNNIAFIMADFKRVELNAYRNFKNCLFCNDYREFIKILERLHAEMMDRYSLLEKYGFSDIDQYNKGRVNKLPYIVLIIDEIANLKLSGLGGERLEELLINILNMGRAGGIHVIAATQRASHIQLSTEIRSGLISRISFAILENLTQKMAGVMDTQDLGQGEFKTAKIGFNGITFKGYFVDKVKEWTIFNELNKVYGSDGGVKLEKVH